MQRLVRGAGGAARKGKIMSETKQCVVIEEADYLDAADQFMGWCTSCQEFTRECTEPDINAGEPGYDCPKCEQNTVMGAEQALLLGEITV